MHIKIDNLLNIRGTSNAKSFNVVLIGSPTNIGKTQLTHKLVNAHCPFQEDTPSAPETSFYHTPTTADTGSIQYCDTQGGEAQQTLVPMFLRDHNLILLCYDCSDANALASLKKDLALLKMHGVLGDHILLVGLKNDTVGNAANKRLNKFGDLANLIRATAQNQPDRALILGQLEELFSAPALRL